MIGVQMYDIRARILEFAIRNPQSAVYMIGAPRSGSLQYLAKEVTEITEGAGMVLYALRPALRCSGSIQILARQTDS
jgi:hypothetical protein